MLLIPYFNSCVSSSVQPRSGPHMTKSRNTARCSVSPQSRRLRCVPHTPRTLSKTPRTLVCTLLRFASSGRLDRRHPRCPLGCERFPCLLFNLRALFKREKKKKEEKRTTRKFFPSRGFFEREKKTSPARCLFSLEEHKPASDERNRAPPPFLCSHTHTLSLFKDDKGFCEMTPHKKKQADQEVMMTLVIKRKGQNAKRENYFIIERRKTKTTLTKKLCFANF